MFGTWIGSSRIGLNLVTNMIGSKEKKTDPVWKPRHGADHDVLDRPGGEEEEEPGNTEGRC